MKKSIRALLIAVLAFLGGVAYRMGGSGNYPRFFRELGQMLCYPAIMYLQGMLTFAWRPLLGIFLGMGLTWLESTYFKKKGTDAKWWNWAMVGGVFGLIPLPYCWLTGSHWLGFGVRFGVCVSLTVFWQEFLSQKVCDWINKYILKWFFKTVAPIGNDVTDEVGRGFINLATLPLLLI